MSEPNGPETVEAALSHLPQGPRSWQRSRSCSPTPGPYRMTCWNPRSISCASASVGAVSRPYLRRFRQMTQDSARAC